MKTQRQQLIEVIIIIIIIIIITINTTTNTTTTTTTTATTTMAVDVRGTILITMGIYRKLLKMTSCSVKTIGNTKKRAVFNKIFHFDHSTSLQCQELKHARQAATILKYMTNIQQSITHI
jgi:hypothetical protein